MKETIAYLNSLLKDNDTIIIGLSGGPDSMCLLNIVLSLNKNIKVVCAHINHNIREESFQEMKFIKKYCSKLPVILETTTFSKKSSTSNYSEQELREKRYQYFEDVINKYKAQYLFTAHHGDDLVETILMRLSRGSTIKGYSGFQIETAKINYKIIRPLIFTNKEEIEKYNVSQNIPYVTDATNNENKYTRNRYRHTILPFLKKEQPNVHLKYLKFSRELIAYNNFVEKIVNAELEKRLKRGTLDITSFSELDPLIKRKLIEKLLDNNYPDNLYLVSDKHVQLILNIIENPRPNLELNFPNEIKIVKSYNKLKIVRRKQEVDDYILKLTEDLTLPNNHRLEFLKETDNTSNFCLRLNSDEVKLPLYVRNRKVGDKMIIKNMKNPKKIKDIFIDSKLTTEERNNQPIVIDSSGEIIWLPGLKKSKFDKAKKENYDIILWYN